MKLSRRRALLLGGAWAASGPLAAAEARPFEADALAWVRANAHPLSADTAITELAPIVGRLSQARIVGIGEATHGTHEDFALKCQLIKALVTFGGIRCIALEANLSAGLAIDAYVRDGVGDITAILRDSGFFQNWQSEEFGGLFTWLRGWNLAGKEPVRVIAIDCQASPADAWYAMGWLERVGSSDVEPLRPRLAGLMTPGNRKMRLLEVLMAMTGAERDGYLAALADLKAAIGRQQDAPGKALALHAAETARQGLLVFERAVKDGPDLPTSAAYEARRDRYMADNLIALAGKDRAALHAHNWHVLPVPYDTSPEAEGTQGLYLRRKLGQAYQTVAFEYDHGTIHAKRMKAGDTPPGRDKPWLVVSRPSWPGSLGALLARSGIERFWLDLRLPPPTPALKAWREHRYLHDWQGFVVVDDQAPGEDDRLPIEGVFDLLVFFRAVTPSRFYDYVGQA